VRPSPKIAVLIFLCSVVLLFLGMSSTPSVYDEGLTDTAAIRVAAGQLPHRDFYSVYGPAQFYVLAALFKLFGTSLLIERLYSLFIESLFVATVYWIASPFCRRSTTLALAIVACAWNFGIMGTAGSPLFPALLMNTLACAAILPVFTGNVSGLRLLVLGASAGLAFLFRYDTGAALFVILLVLIAAAFWFQPARTGSTRLLGLYLTYAAGFALVAGPPILFYLSRAGTQFFVHDIVVYPGKYYRAARGLPLPGITLKSLDNLEFYLPLFVFLAAWFLILRMAFQRFRRIPVEQPAQAAFGFLLTFTLLGTVMYFKGMVRAGIGQAFLAIIPSLFLVAWLYDRRHTLSPIFSRSARIFAAVSVLAVAWSCLHTAAHFYLHRDAIPFHLIASWRGTDPPNIQAWCRQRGPLTRGLCFVPDDDHIQAIEYLAAHTAPGDTLFVGLPQHQRIFINDNITYFGTDRLPATHWSHFDPDLQNRADIQAQIIREFSASPPAFVVEDSEFERSDEPNDSSKSSGVTLLDDYIHAHYGHPIVFGEMTLLRRSNP
jgi:hypothetical protein